MKLTNPVITSIILMFPFLCIGNENIDNQRPKVAVVLSGGGAKGFAHIGVLKVLEQEGIPIDIIVGTSMGSLIGGFYSIGYSANEIEEIVKKQNWEQVLSDNVSRKMISKNDQTLKQRYFMSFSFSDTKSVGLPQGVIKGQNVLNVLCNLAGKVPEDADFSQFPVSFACVATDLETGGEVVINNGFFPTALFASMAIPGVFQPILRDSLLLADGGVVNNFPTDVAKQMGADIIIGVDIRGDLKRKEELTSIDQIFNQMIGFLGQERDSINNSLCDIIIRPDINGYSVGSFTREAADSLILRGERETHVHLTQIRELKRKYSFSQRKYSREFIVNEKWNITDIRFTGNYQIDKTFLESKLNMDLPGFYSSEQIKNAIDRLYGLGGFDLVYFYLTDNNKSKTLNINITPRREYSQQIGFKVNTIDAAALLFNISRRNYEKTIRCISLSTELSVNPGISIAAEINKGNLPTVGIELNGKYQQYSIHEKGEKLYNADLFYASGGIYIYKLVFNKLNITAGIQEEYFNGDIFSKNINSTVLSSETDQLLSNVYANFTFDNWDNFYFPSKGIRLDVEFSFYTGFSEIDDFYPVLLVKMDNVIPVSSNVAFLFDLYSRSLFNSNYPQVKTTIVGGEAYSQYFNHHLPFIGLSPVVVADNFTNIALSGLRIKLPKKQYVTLMYNVMVQGKELNEWSNYNTTGGGGIKYSKNTILGPVDIGVGYSKKFDKPTFSANMGFWF